jgi:hypothetical protein
MLIRPNGNEFYSSRNIFLPSVNNYLIGQANSISYKNVVLINNFLTELYFNGLYSSLQECFLLGSDFNLTSDYLGLISQSFGTITGTIGRDARFSSFTGSQKISTNCLPPVGTNPRCIYCLINDANTTGGLQGFWAYGSDSYGTGMFLWYDNVSGQIICDYGSGINLGLSVKKNTWYLHAFQYSGGLSTAWINGQQILSGATSINTSSNNSLVIGGWFGPSPRPVNGQIGAAVVFNRELTSQEHITFTNITKKTIARDLF